MTLSGKAICEQIRLGSGGDPDGIAIAPLPDLGAVERSGEASVSLRLGRWFVSLRQSSETHLAATPEGFVNENRYSKQSFVPFGGKFVLHPGRFVLASTMEWIRLPAQISAWVTGKSTLGRRGIIIETAAGVHPGFCGCLTLEIANVGEIPVELITGMQICQLFFHRVHGPASISQTSLAGQRKPRLGQIRSDPILERLLKSRL